MPPVKTRWKLEIWFDNFDSRNHLLITEKKLSTYLTAGTSCRQLWQLFQAISSFCSCHQPQQPKKISRALTCCWQHCPYCQHDQTYVSFSFSLRYSFPDQEKIFLSKRYHLIWKLIETQDKMKYMMKQLILSAWGMGSSNLSKKKQSQSCFKAAQ